MIDTGSREALRYCCQCIHTTYVPGARIVVAVLELKNGQRVVGQSDVITDDQGVSCAAAQQQATDNAFDRFRLWRFALAPQLLNEYREGLTS